MDKEQLQAAIQNVHDENLRAILQAFFDYNYPTMILTLKDKGLGEFNV